MKKLLIIGVSGFIGSNLARYLRKKYRIFGTFYNHKPYIDNIVPLRVSIDKIPNLVKSLTPDYIAYCLNPKKELMEKDPALSTEININLPIILTKSINKESQLFYFSSAEVFNGEQGDYEEDDEKTPNSFFGILKDRAENYLKIFENVIILRMGLPIGLGSYFHPSVFDVIYKKLSHKEQLFLDSSKKMSIFYVEDLARAMEILIEESKLIDRIYNFSNGQKMTQFEFGKFVANTFSFDTNLILTKEEKKIDYTLDGTLFCHKFSFRFTNIARFLEMLKNKI